MTTVKINQKNYVVPELTFEHSVMMEQMGLSVEGMLSKKYLFTAIAAFTAIVAKCELEQANHLMEQHVLGGGNLEDVYKAYVDAISTSGFFRRLLHLDEQEEKQGRKKSSVKTESRMTKDEKESQ